MRRVLAWLAVPLVLILAIAAAFWIHPLWFSDQAIRFGLWRAGVHSRFIEVDGHRIHYFETGPSDGPTRTPVLLIHGLGARGEDWSPILRSLAHAGYHVYAPDLLGYGRSDKPDVNYSISLETQMVDHFMTAVHLDTADVGGWSMGGWVSMKLAVDHSRRVERLILYDSAGVYFPARFDASLFAPDDPAGLARLFSKLTPRPPHLPEFLRRDLLRKLGQNRWILYRIMSSMTSGRDLMEFRLHEIHQPMLIVWGTEDTLIPPEAGRKIHRLVSGSSFALVEGCGHLAPSECSPPIIRETLRFLSSEPPLHSAEKTFPMELTNSRSERKTEMTGK